jgi:asparagine synthase (glutamine-hydrolysing)
VQHRGAAVLIGQLELEPTALADFLTFLWVPDPKRAFRQIAKLPPGHYARPDRNGLDVTQCWDFRFEPEERSEQEWRAEVRTAVEAAVRRQMVSDVPLGSFLSGGVDSSAIVSGRPAACPRSRVAVRDRPPRANLGAERARAALPKAIWHLEEPIADPAAISPYLICTEARREMPVMLSGVGGDEVCAG